MIKIVVSVAEWSVFPKSWCFLNVLRSEGFKLLAIAHTFLNTKPPTAMGSWGHYFFDGEELWLILHHSPWFLHQTPELSTPQVLEPFYG
jgi:hypothetical protein